ncbi:hypothetical protein Taro_025521 [Colocasia esculenta]|uniref:Uncharacterized protein n=1 Tax=Colocasia esculenta TaxID=4460 RepID=A0A843VNK0_COLES|nr:hypothetical protein [Colocasia esculenta]
MVAPGEPVVTGFETRHTWPSRHGRDEVGHRVLVAASGGITTTFLTDLTAVLSVRTALSGVSHALGGRRDMVATPMGVATCSLSRGADPFGVAFGRIIPEPLSVENATCIEVVMMSQPAMLPRHHRDAPLHRDLVATGGAVVIALARCVTTIVETASCVVVTTCRFYGVSDHGKTSQQWQGARRAEETGCQRRTPVTEDRTALLERILRLRPLMFFGEYDPDKAESWTHELECTFETMECTEEDQSFTWCSALEGLTHVRGCYRCLGPPSSEPIEGVLRATSVLELAAQQANSGAKGKMVVTTAALSHLQSSRGWSGTPRTVRLLSNGRACARQTRRGGSGGPRS